MAKAKKAKAAKQLEKVPQLVRGACCVVLQDSGFRSDVREIVLGELGYDQDEDIDKIPDDLWMEVETQICKLVDAVIEVLK